jgi:hypothetical protein
MLKYSHIKKTIKSNKIVAACKSGKKIVGLKLVQDNSTKGESNFCIYDWFYIKGFVNHQSSIIFKKRP